MPSSINEHNLLIVDDDENIQRLLVMATKDHGWRPAVASNGKECLDLLSPSLAAVILDYNLPEMSGLETLPKIREKYPDLPIIMLTGVNEVETAVHAMRAGATDYITKPFELKPLMNLLGQCRRDNKNGSSSAAPATPENRTVARSAATKSSSDEFRSKNRQLSKMLKQLGKAARLDSTILLSGESGTGKTCFAREIHRLSPRADEAFITVSCPALPRELLESELFGHERGAFTGATTSRTGRFEQASDGTLFLDEIGDLPQDLQPKLLNVLQDREFFRVGGSKQLQTNTRLIAATNINLSKRVEEGSFREDLYYRLNIIEFHIPALRERVEDIPDLALEILSNIAGRRGVNGWKLSSGATELLCQYDWPGNVRQLENVLERATAFSEHEELCEDDIDPLLKRRDSVSTTEAGPSNRAMTLQELERNAFIAAYESTGKNKAKTARKLGISERSVYNLVARHGIK